MENLLLILGSTGEFDFDDLLYCFKHDRTPPKSDSQIFNQEFIKFVNEQSLLKLKSIKND